MRENEKSDAYASGGAVMQGGVSAPAEALVGREAAGALAFEEEDALVEGVVVVLAVAGDRRLREEEQEKEEKGAKKRNIPLENQTVSRHFLLRPKK